MILQGENIDSTSEPGERESVKFLRIFEKLELNMPLLLRMIYVHMTPLYAHHFFCFFKYHFDLNKSKKRNNRIDILFTWPEKGDGGFLIFCTLLAIRVMEVLVVKRSENYEEEINRR